MGRSDATLASRPQRIAGQVLIFTGDPAQRVHIKPIPPKKAAMPDQGWEACIWHLREKHKRTGSRRR